MFKPDDPRDITRLRSQIKQASRDQEPFVNFHRNAWKQCTGHLYGGRQGEPETILPEIALLFGTIMSELAASPPQASMTTSDVLFKAQAEKFRLILNSKLKADKDSFAAMQQAINASLFTIGIGYVGTKVKGSLDITGYGMKDVCPYVKNILLEDFFHDMRTKRIQDGEFQGHVYDMDWEEAKSHKSFDEKVRSRLQPDYSAQGRDGVQRMDTVGGLVSPRQEGIHKRTTLVEVWIPEDNIVLIMPNDPVLKDKSDVLQVIKWKGPSHGPYHYLGYKWVDGNTMPLSTTMEVLPLHNAVNNAGRKMFDSVEAFKQIGIASGEAESAEVRKVQNARHGDVVHTQHPHPLMTETIGGVEQALPAALTLGMEWFSYFTGGLSLLAGSQAQSATLGQDQILQQQSNRRLDAMRVQVLSFIKDIVTDYAYWMWESGETYSGYYENGNRPLPMFSYPEQRSYDFWSHSIDIMPYSMSLNTPRQRFSELLMMLDKFAQYWPMFQQQGAQIDTRRLLTIAARDLDRPELMEIIKFRSKPQGSENQQAPPEVRQPTGQPQNRMQPQQQNETPGTRMAESLLKMGNGNANQ